MLGCHQHGLHLRTPGIRQVRLHGQTFPLCRNSYHSHRRWSGKPLPSERLETPCPPAESCVRPWTAIRCRLHEELYQLLGIEAATSTTYHPQTDGQTERVNQELEQYLQIFVGERQDDWYTRLPLVEFSYNNHIHSTMQQTPCLLNTSRHPWMGFELHQPPSHFKAVNEFTDWMKDTLQEAKLALAKAKDDMAWYYNHRRSAALSFSHGNMVYLDSEDIQTTHLSKKLLHRRLGPYLVKRHVRKYAYHLVLPPPMRRLHAVFNVVKLSPTPDDPIVGRC